MPNTIIFDLDGTLIDCKNLHQAAFRKAIAIVDPSIEFNDYEVEGMSTKAKIAYLKTKGYDIPTTVDNIKRTITNDLFDEYVKPNRELSELILQLSKKYTLCIASNSRSEFVYRCMIKMNIWSLRCVITNEFGPAKPNPWMYHECMRITNSESNTTMIFEDSSVGIEAARLTSARVIEVKNQADTIQKIKELL